MAYDTELADRIRAALSFSAGVTEKLMFGGCAFLKDGHLLASASGRGGLLLRVQPQGADALLDPPRVERFVMKGREPPGWLWIDTAALEEDGALEHWLGLGLSFVDGLPPK